MPPTDDETRGVVSRTASQARLGVESFSDTVAALERQTVGDATIAHIGDLVTMNDDFEVVAQRTWQIDSDDLIGLDLDLGDEALVPIPATGTEPTDRNRVRIATPYGERVVLPVRERALANLGVRSESVLKRWLAVPMKREEYVSSPQVDVEVELNADRARARHRSFLNWGASRPSDFLIHGLKGLPTAGGLTFNLPSDATSDNLVIIGTFNYKSLADDLRVAIKKFETDAGVSKLNLVTTINEYATYGRDVGREFAGVLRGSAVSARTGRRMMRVFLWAQRWLLPWRRFPFQPTLFADLKRSYEKWVSTAEEWQELGSGQIVKEAKALAEALEKPCRFYLLSSLTEAQGLHDAPRLDSLGEGLRSQGLSMSLEEAFVPYTANRKDGLSRAGLVTAILLLAVTEILVAGCDVAWVLALPQPTSLHGVAESLIQRLAASPRDLRSPIVSVLLLFPAIIAGPLFLSRPKTPLASRTDGRAFWHLSLLFFVPVLQAGYLASGGSYFVFSISCAVTASICLIVSIWVHWAFSTQGLKCARMKQLRKLTMSALRNEPSRTPLGFLRTWAN